jgi:hypothetical protein
MEIINIIIGFLALLINIGQLIIAIQIYKKIKYYKKEAKKAFKEARITDGMVNIRRFHKEKIDPKQRIYKPNKIKHSSKPEQNTVDELGYALENCYINTNPL